MMSCSIISCNASSSAIAAGGALHLETSSMSLHNTTAHACTTAASTVAGGFALLVGGSWLGLLAGSALTDCTSSAQEIRGGAILVDGSVLLLRDAIISNIRAVSAPAISGNSGHQAIRPPAHQRADGIIAAWSGSEVSAYRSSFVNLTLISDHVAFGGTIQCRGSNVELHDSMIQHSRAHCKRWSWGGAIHALGDSSRKAYLRLVRTSIIDSIASGSYATGGALSAERGNMNGQTNDRVEITVNQSRIEDCHATTLPAEPHEQTVVRLLSYYWNGGRISTSMTGARGGAVCLRTPQIAMSLVGTLIQSCSCTAINTTSPPSYDRVVSDALDGGLITSDGATLLMSDGTLLQNGSLHPIGNVSALTPQGSLIQVVSGMAVYMLPAPQAFWVPASLCEPYYNPCEAPGCDRTTMGLASLQRCAFNSTPELLDRWVETLPEAPVDVAQYPYACVSGTYGADTSAESQSSSRCSGLCPPGKVCGQNATTNPTNCSAGMVCPAGSAIGQGCPAGRYSSAANLAVAEQCLITQAGWSSSTGSLAPVRCSPGSFSPSPGAAECTRCSSGSFQGDAGTSACHACSKGGCEPERTQT